VEYRSVYQFAPGRHGSELEVSLVVVSYLFPW
jgi:hypothetical protein